MPIGEFKPHPTRNSVERAKHENGCIGPPPSTIWGNATYRSYVQRIIRHTL